MVAAAFPVATGAVTLGVAVPTADPDEEAEDPVVVEDPVVDDVPAVDDVPEVVEEGAEVCEESELPDDDWCLAEAATELELAPDDATQENVPAKASPPAATADVNQRTRRRAEVRR